MSPALVVVLVGPKGAGKTTLGRMLERLPDVRFLEVEAIAKRLLAAMGNIIDEGYARRAFEAIAAQVALMSGAHRVIIIETTGASEETPWFFDTLRRRHELRLVRVNARAETCATRIAERDPSQQVQVSPELVRTMHERTQALKLTWDLELMNDPPLSREHVERAFASLLGSAPRSGD